MKNEQITEIRDKVRDQIQQKGKQMITRVIRQSLEWLLNFLGGSSDLASLGTSLFVTPMMYFFTLGDLNMQMIWGYYITKQRSIFFPPLKWPIKIPLLSDLWLHAALLIFDALLLFLFVIFIVIIIVVIFGVQLSLAGAAAGLYTFVVDPTFRAFVIETVGGFITF